MSAVSRKTSRDAFAALVTTALGAIGVTVKTSEYSGFLHDAPVAVVKSGGSSRAQRYLDNNKSRGAFALSVVVYVPDSTTRAGETWTDSDAEDRLDAIEVALADMVIANRRTASWLNLTWDADFSEIEDVAESGKPYKRERHTYVLMVDDA